MGLPKHKQSKTKSRQRKSNAYYTMKTPNLSICPNCKERKLSHRVCPHCGFYNGKQIITKVVKEDK